MTDEEKPPTIMETFMARMAEAPPGPPEPSKSSVHMEYLRLSASAKARELLARAEAEAKFKPPTDLGIRTFLSVEPAEPSYHVEGWWPYGGMVVIEASKKWGKSTLVRNTVESVMSAKPFLDRFEVTSPFRRVLIIDMELTHRQMFDYWDGSTLDDTQAVVWHLRGSTSTLAIRSEWVRKELVKRWIDLDVDLVVIDPLGPLLRANSWEENSNDGVGRALDLLDEMRAEAGVTGLLIPHHTGHSGEHGRGASVLGDKADAIWRGAFTRPGDITGPRFLGAVGRGVDMESTELGFDPSSRKLFISEFSRPRSLVAKMAKEDKAAAEHARRVADVEAALAAVPDGFDSNAALTGYLGVRWNGDILAQVRAALVASEVIDKGRGWHPTKKSESQKSL